MNYAFNIHSAGTGMRGCYREQDDEEVLCEGEGEGGGGKRENLNGRPCLLI